LFDSKYSETTHCCQSVALTTLYLFMLHRTNVNHPPKKRRKANLLIQRLLRRYNHLSMPHDHIVALLIAERDKRNQAIAALTGGFTAKRRGRPPKNAAAVVATAPAPAVAPKKHGRTFSAAQRKAASERMRARWAAKKAGDRSAVPKPAKTAKKS
jgi:hypothetical protein